MATSTLKSSRQSHVSKANNNASIDASVANFKCFLSQIEQIKGAQVEKFKVLKWFHVNPENWEKIST